MKIYSISPNYSKVELWDGHVSGRRIARHTCTPVRKLKRHERYEVVRDWLKGHGVTPPQFTHFTPRLF